MSSSFGESLPIPKHSSEISLGFSLDTGNVLLTTHADTILAMLVVANNHEAAELKIKGRSIEEPGQTMAIVEDEIYDTFVNWRSSLRGQVFKEAAKISGKDLSQVSIRVEDGAGKKFPCKYYDFNELLDRCFGDAADITPNHLVPVLGALVFTESAQA